MFSTLNNVLNKMNTVPQRGFQKISQYPFLKVLEQSMFILLGAIGIKKDVGDRCKILHLIGGSTNPPVVFRKIYLVKRG